MRAAALAGAVALGLVAPGAARAEPAQRRVEPERTAIERTAYTLRGGEVSLGLLSAQVGATDEITVGTYVPPWFLFPVLKSPVPSAFIKARDWFHGPVALSVRGSVLYFNAASLSSDLTDNERARASLWAFPVDGAASIRYSDRLTQSFELTYVRLSARARLPGDTTVAGAAAASTVTLSAFHELRLTRVTSLTLLGRVRLWQSDARMDFDIESSETTAKAELGARRRGDRAAWNVVPGVAFRGEHVNVELGVGYGSNWIPFVELPVAQRTVVPQVNAFVRF